MKAYLFLLLIGMTLSAMCVKYITEKMEGSVSGLIFKSCSCPTGFKGIMSALDDDSCMCFLKEELALCESDPKCEIAPSIGCQEK